MNQIVTITRRHWLPLLGLNSLLIAATICAAIFAPMISPPRWQASAKLNLPQTTGDLNASLGTLGNLQSRSLGFSKDLNPLQTQFSILTSDIVLGRVLATDPEKSLYPRLSDYQALFQVSPQAESTIILLQAQGSSPELARKRVATLLEVYQQRLNELRHNDVDVREQFSQKDIARAHDNLIQAQNQLAKFQQSTGLVDTSEQTKGLIAAINNLKTTQATVVATAQDNETQAKVAAARLGMAPQQAMNSLRLGENKEYQAIRDKLSQVDTALADARSVYTEQAPKVQSLLQEHQQLSSILRQRIATAVPDATAKGIDTSLGGNNGAKDTRIDMIAELLKTQTVAKGLQQQADQLQTQVDKLSAELNSVSKNQTQLLDLQRKYEIAEGVYKGMIAQVQQAKTNPFSVYPDVQTLDDPNVDPKPLKPKRWLIALGGLLASIFGSTALVLFLEARKPLLGPKDLQQVECPMLFRISRLKRPSMERALGADIEIDFQRLASAISSLILENNRLMVTSSTFGEGKTTVTLGLALALVNFGFRVLIVDGDLHQAEMSRRLGHSRKERDSKSPIPVRPGLDLMPAPLIPKDRIAEFFARGTFEQRLSTIQTSGSYDYVLVDSAPVSLAVEPTLMSAVVHNVLFVVRPGTSDRYSVTDSIDQLAHHNAKIRGLVVNGVESRTEGYRYGLQRELLEAEA